VPSIYDLKPRFQNLLRPSMRAMAAAGITPNAVTLAAIAGSGIAAFLSLRYTLLILPLWLFLRMALNAIDGMMARELNQSTRLGAILNELGDVLSDIALYLPLALLAAPVAVFLFVTGSILTEFCGVLQQALTGKRRYEGPMGKSDRALATGLLAIVTACAPPTVDYWAWIFSTLTLLTIVTCFNRFK
jgi:CDP-diacylglycerol---glycerol-3-phosphate 3-phosphatidyltransferase